VENEFPNPRTHACVARDSCCCQALALVFSHTPSAGLGKLTSQRCTSALPFAGRYRLIDLALSNCVNSGIGNVGVIAQYQPRSLRAYLADGRPWGLDRHEGGLELLPPHGTQAGRGWYKGTADAIDRNWEFISRSQADQVLILTGSEVHAMDLSNLVAQHHKEKADLIIAAVAIARESAGRYYTLVVDREGWARAWILPGASRPGPLAVMGALLFSREALRRRLREDAQQPDSTHDLFHDVIPAMFKAGDRVMAFQHAGYWNGMRDVHDYWQASMDLVHEDPGLSLLDGAWPIYTQCEVQPPARIARGAVVSRSLISEGCVIEGTVEGSVLSPGVQVAVGAVLRNAVVMHGSALEERALVENAILDANVIVGPQARVGKLCRHAPTLKASTPDQLTVVGQGTRISTCATIRPSPAGGDWRPAARRDAPARILGPYPVPVAEAVDVRST
jgi:glucose-1-phosphate adenylyltransferase